MPSLWDDTTIETVLYYVLFEFIIGLVELDGNINSF